MTKQRQKEVEYIISQLERIQARMWVLMGEEETLYDMFVSTFLWGRDAEQSLTNIEQLDRSQEAIDIIIGYLNKLK